MKKGRNFRPFSCAPFNFSKQSFQASTVNFGDILQGAGMAVGGCRQAEWQSDPLAIRPVGSKAIEFARTL